MTSPTNPTPASIEDRQGMGASSDEDRATAAEPVVSALRDGIPSALVCDVCRQNEALGVASSALGPCSWAYCRECLNKPAEVAVMIDATIDGCNGSANVAAWAKQFWTWEDGAYISWADYAAKHEARILAEAAERDAQGIEAAQADETRSGSAVGESPVTERSCAQRRSPWII